MKRAHLTPIATLLAASFLGAACVTVNVNFPESSVQKATDDYVKELYRSKNKKPGEEAPAAKPSTGSYFELIPNAEAVEVEATFRTDTAGAKAIQARQASRLGEIDAQKRAGVLGESSDGMLIIKSPDKLKPLLAKKIDGTVREENADRQKLYQEVQEANGLKPERLKDVQKSFARSFQSASPSGTWIQADDGGAWSQKH